MTYIKVPVYKSVSIRTYIRVPVHKSVSIRTCIRVPVCDLYKSTRV